MSKGLIVTVLATQLAEAVEKDEKSDGCDIANGLFGIHTSMFIREISEQLWQSMCNYPNCTQCGRPTEKLKGATLYPLSIDNRHNTYYRCKTCYSIAGCIEGTDELYSEFVKPFKNRSKEC